MHRLPPTGLKSRNLIPNTLRSCLGPLDLPYNWGGKLFELLLALSLARSLLLKDLARFSGRSVKTGINRFSALLKQPRLDFSRQRERLLVAILRSLGSRRLYLYRGKVVVIVDTTEHEKRRSRGKKKRMPAIGSVRMKNVPGRERLLAPGYHEIWTGVLLKNRTCLGLTRFLFSDKAPWFRSQSLLEEIEIYRVQRLIWKALKRRVILVGDRGFRRKDLLHTLAQKPRTDFLIRLQGDLTVTLRGHKPGRLSRLAVWQPQRCRAFWREDSKRPRPCSVSAFGARVQVSKASFLRLRILCIAAADEEREPIYLATTLPVDTVEAVRRLVWLYSSRWTIETFFFSFKRSFGAHRFRVFASWSSVDRLLDLAHMAFLILALLFVLSEKAAGAALRRLRRSVDALLRRWSLSAPVLTLGRFLEALAMDFAQCPNAWRKV